ncbi:Hypothetical_protein [Hexamita inflata]|uniref:Hypothetical_protein n=1 Tax=Hexamita inflata TaxID=28002 RepID=A0AA86NRU2_9EUKA|nr:Hypothetical protein HINF_LOCUS11336 [Hexamita inflata]
MRILGGDSLTLEDKQYLQQFCMDHTQWSHKETTEYILENYFQNKKDINYWYLYKLVYNCNQRIKQQQIISNNEARKDYRTVYSQTIRDSLTQIYKHGITEILHIDLSDYQQDQICQFIDSMNQSTKIQFWKYLVSVVRPQKTLNQIKMQYQCKYRSVLFKTHLTDEDKQLILKQCSQLQSERISNMAKRIYKKYFISKNIFYYEVYHFILRKYKRAENDQQQKVNQILFSQQQRNNFHCIAYKLGLKTILDQDCSNLTPKEICQLILSLNETQTKTFWNVVTNNCALQQTSKALKHYFLREFRQAMYSYIITKEDQKYIQTYFEEHANLTITEITQQLMNDYFKNKDVYYYEVYKIVYLTKKKAQKSNDKIKNYNIQIKNATNQLDTYTKWIKLTLFQLNIIKNDEISQKDVCNIINNLDQSKQLLFWKKLAKNFQPNKNLQILRTYYKNYYQQVLYDDLNPVDDLYMKTYCDNNITFTSQEIKNHCLGYLQNKNVNNYKVINNILTYFKTSQRNYQKQHQKHLK